MYNLSYFKESDPAIVLEFVRKHSFALLTGCDSKQRPVATQIPLFIDEKEGDIFLSGHMMRNTDHHLAFTQNDNVLSIFTGPNHYVSASWYTDAQQGSTWNYISVHARGHIRFLGQEELLAVLERTTSHYENNVDSPAGFKNIPDSYIEQMSKAIVAFEIKVEELNNVFKLSQNRDEISYDNIIRELRTKSNDGQQIAELMEQRRSRVFGDNK